MSSVSTEETERLACADFGGPARHPETCILPTHSSLHMTISVEQCNGNHLVQHPVGYKAIVGIGQTADCADGTTLIPLEVDLQLNGPICNLIQEDPTISCTFCSTKQDGLQLSTCIQIEDYPGFVADDSVRQQERQEEEKG
jgi:hypothetical protein